jgi:hypothetical protein
MNADASVFGLDLVRAVAIGLVLPEPFGRRP